MLLFIVMPDREAHLSKPLTRLVTLVAPTRGARSIRRPRPCRRIRRPHASVGASDMSQPMGLSAERWKAQRKKSIKSARAPFGANWHGSCSMSGHAQQTSSVRRPPCAETEGRNLCFERVPNTNRRLEHGRRPSVCGKATLESTD
jgi:hypothetical protein